MLTTLMILTVLTSPITEKKDPCEGLEAGEWHRCQPRVINLGAWDVRPNADQWPTNATLDAPKAWGEYATERRD